MKKKQKKCRMERTKVRQMTAGCTTIQASRRAALTTETSPCPLEEAHSPSRNCAELNNLLTKAASSNPPGGLSPWALAS